MQGSSSQKESTSHLNHSDFLKSASKPQKLINSPNFTTVVTKINEKKSFQQEIKNRTPNKRRQIRNPMYFTDNIYTENFVMSRGKLTPEPILRYDKKYIRIQKIQDDQDLLFRRNSVFKVEDQSFQNGLLVYDSKRELSGEEIEIYLKKFTKRMQDSAERAKKELLKRTVCSEKLLKNMQKVRNAKKKLDKSYEKHSFEKIKKLGISLIESSNRRSQIMKTHKNKLIRLNKGHFNVWAKKYEEIQMVQTHRERKIVEDSLKREQKSKEISLAIQKITKKDKKKDTKSKTSKKVAQTHTENFRKKIAEKIKEIDEF